MRWHPIVQGEVEWTSSETGHKYDLNNKKASTSRSASAGQYNVVLKKDARNFFTSTHHGRSGRNHAGHRLEERTSAAARPGLTRNKPSETRGELKARPTRKSWHAERQLKAARTAEEAKDYETAITTLNEANQIDATAIRSGTTGQRYLNSAPKQATPRKNRSGMSWPKPIT